MKSLSFILSLFFLFSANSKALEKVIIKTSPELAGYLDVKVQIGKKSKSFHRLSSSSEKKFKVRKLKTLKITVKQSISTEVGRKSYSIPTVFYGIDKNKTQYSFNRSKGTKVKIGKKLKVRMKCFRNIKPRVSNKTLVIDLSSYRNLSSCEGSEIYRPSGIGNREISDTGKNKYSWEEDIQLGDEYARQFVAENREHILDQDHPMSQYARSTMESIAINSDTPWLKPKVWVINADILNAFALPGGSVFVFRGLIDAAEDEASLIGVLGHEWAHVTARHGTKNLTRSRKVLIAAVAGYYAGKIASELTRSQWKSALFSLGGDLSIISGVGYLAGKSRKAESEADRLGAQYAYRAGYTPYGVAHMFETFSKLSPRKANFVEKIFSSHPDHKTRIHNNYVLTPVFFDVDYEPRTSNTLEYVAAVTELDRMGYPSSEISWGTAEAFSLGLKEFYFRKALGAVPFDFSNSEIDKLVSLQNFKEPAKKGWLRTGLKALGSVAAAFLSKDSEEDSSEENKE